MANSPSERPERTSGTPKPKGPDNLVDRWLERVDGGITRRDATLKRLRAGQTLRDRNAESRDLRGISLRGESLKGVDLSQCDLTRADLRDAELVGSRLISSDLTGASLQGANLTRADLRKATLENAALNGANLEHADLERANLKQSSLVEANLELATLREANLENADLSGAILRSAKLTEANLRGIKAVQTLFTDSDLSMSDVRRANFERADLRGTHLRGLKGFHRASFLKADIRDVHFGGAYGLRRQIVDEDYLDEFRRRSSAHALVHWLWWLTSGCGRGIFRWCAWGLVVIVAFGWAYQEAGIGTAEGSTPLTPYLISTQVFSSFGFTPVEASDLRVEALVIAESLLGLIFLAGAFAILSQVMARRGD